MGAGFTLLPFVSPVQLLEEGGTVSVSCSVFALSGDLLQSQRTALSTKVIIIIFSLESHLLCFTSCPSKSPWDPRGDTHRATAALQ